jgi:FkbM family methyltransferase
MNLLGKFFRKTSALAYHSFRFFDTLSIRVAPPVKSLCEVNKAKWYAVDGDHNLRVEYDLGPDSVVYDIGGYEGDWAAEISSRYSSKVFVFEPVSKFVELLQKRLGKNPGIKILPVGLGGRNEEMSIAVIEESSSVFRDQGNFQNKASEKEVIRLRAINEMMQELNTPEIDLMKINIEGGEYDLLECLIEKGLVKNIKNLQIQFHDFVPDAEARMKRIKSLLALTHKLTYEYVFVWENWELKSST